jgi:hypothetical protein
MQNCSKYSREFRGPREIDSEAQGPRLSHLSCGPAPAAPEAAQLEPEWASAETFAQTQATCQCQLTMDSETLSESAPSQLQPAGGYVPSESLNLRSRLGKNASTPAATKRRRVGDAAVTTQGPGHNLKSGRVKCGDHQADTARLASQNYLVAITSHEQTRTQLEKSVLDSQARQYMTHTHQF